MKLFVLLALAAVVLAYNEVALPVVHDTWSGAIVGTDVTNGITWTKAINIGDYQHRQLAVLVRANGGQITCNLTVWDWEDRNNFLDYRYRLELMTIGMGESMALTIPGTYWAKTHHGSGAYTVKFNVICPAGGSYSILWDDVPAVSDTDYLSINGSWAMSYQWAPSHVIRGPAYFGVGVYMQTFHDHFYIRAKIADIYKVSTTPVKYLFDRAYLSNPNWLSITDDQPVTDPVFVRSCGSGSGCELSQGKSYFTEIRIAPDQLTPGDGVTPVFSITWDALNSATSVTVSLLLLAAMIIAALF